jgi:hypothetical protein
MGGQERVCDLEWEDSEFARRGRMVVGKSVGLDQLGFRALLKVLVVDRSIDASRYGGLLRR